MKKGRRGEGRGKRGEGRGERGEGRGEEGRGERGGTHTSSRSGQERSLPIGLLSGKAPPLCKQGRNI